MPQSASLHYVFPFIILQSENMHKNELDMWFSGLKHYSSEFLSNLPAMTASQKNLPSDIKHVFDIHGTASFDSMLETFNKYIVENGVNTASARYLGFIPGGGVPLSAFAD